MPSQPNSKKLLVAEDAHDKQPLNRFLWIKGNFVYCLAISALFWGVCAAYYIEHFIGWSSITALPPADFGIFVATMFLPLFKALKGAKLTTFIPFFKY